MTYRVEWAPAAEQHLAAAYLAVADPMSVTLAADWVERRLSVMPLYVGRAQSSSVNRYLVRRPLGVLYTVIEDDKRVVVQAVFVVN